MFKDGLPLRVLAIALPLVLSSCGSNEDEGKLSVHPVTGELFVNGEPAKWAQITFHPRQTDPEHPMRPFAQVDEDGSFAASTYVQGDGLPTGEYDITVEWRPFNAFSNTFSGPDRLGEKYSNPQTSGLSIVVNDSAVEIPRMDLQPGPVKKTPGRKKQGIQLVR